MESTITYRVLSFEGESAKEMDNDVNIFLRDENDIVPINVSIDVTTVYDASVQKLKYVCTILYSFKE